MAPVGQYLDSPWRLPCLDLNPTLSKSRVLNYSTVGILDMMSPDDESQFNASCQQVSCPPNCGKA